MKAADKAEAAAPTRNGAYRWPETWTPAQWDERFPGVLDGVSLAAGAANIILQLARPGVGYGVVESRVESGSLFRHPVKRARTTFTYLAVALLGTPDEKLAYRRAVNRSHVQVRSTATSPVKYNAMDPELQLWVAACLAWGSLDTWAKFRGKPDDATADALYARLSPLGTTLQVRPEMWPADRAAFEAYFQRELANLHIDDKVRAYLTALTDLKFLHPALRRVLAPLNRFFTSGFLPPEVREQMHFAWTEDDQKLFDRTLAILGKTTDVLPRTLRVAPVELVMADLRRRLRTGAPLV